MRIGLCSPHRRIIENTICCSSARRRGAGWARVREVRLEDVPLDQRHTHASVRFRCANGSALDGAQILKTTMRYLVPASDIHDRLDQVFGLRVKEVRSTGSCYRQKNRSSSQVTPTTAMAHRIENRPARIPAISAPIVH